MSLTRQAVSGVKWSGVGTLVNVAVNFASIVVLSRLLAPADFGLMAMVGVVTGFAEAFADFGLSNAIIHRQRATSDELSSLFWLNLLVGLTLFALIWLAIPPVVTYYLETRLSGLLRWSSLSFVIVPFGQQFQVLLRRELRFKTLTLVTSITALARLSAVGFALGGFGVMSLVWGNLISDLMHTIMLIAVGSRSRWLPSVHFRRADVSGFVGFGLFQMGQRSLNFFATNVDYLVVGRLLGSEPLGYYTLAYNLMRMPLTYVNPVIVSVAYPAFARVQEREEALRRGYAKIIRYLSVAAFPMTAGMLVVAPLFVPLFYGRQWLPAIPVVQLFCLLGVVKSLGNPLGSLLLARGRADLGFWMNVVAVVGYAIANVTGAHWGIIGVAASSVVFSFLGLVPIDFYLRRLLVHMTVSEFWNAMKQPAAAAAMMLVVILPLYHFLVSFRRDFVALALVVSIGVVVYLVLLRVLDRPLLIELRNHLRSAPSPQA